MLNTFWVIMYFSFCLFYNIPPIISCKYNKQRIPLQYNYIQVNQHQFMTKLYIHKVFQSVKYNQDEILCHICIKSLKSIESRHHAQSHQRVRHFSGVVLHHNRVNGQSTTISVVYILH